MNPQYCVGAYGFRVMHDGSYQVGPGPNGQTQTGQISPGELSQLDADASAVSSDDLSGTETCQGPGGIPGQKDDMDFTRSPGSPTYLIYQGETPQGVNCTRGNPADVDALHTDMNSLMQEYYPNPFPGPSASPSASPTP